MINHLFELPKLIIYSNLIFLNHYVTVSIQCDNVPLAGRVDCGFDGIEEDFCLDQDCCYQDTRDPSVPKCFYNGGTGNQKELIAKETI